MKYKLIKVEDTKIFEEFFDESIFTWEGMDDSEENLTAICDYLKLPENNIIYTYSGKQMNDYYNLKGANSYPDDLTLISVRDYYNPNVKLQVGARWFDDIVTNNADKNKEVK